MGPPFYSCAKTILVPGNQVKIYKSQEQKELLKMGNRVFIDTEECTGCETCVGTIGVGPREPVEIYRITFQK